jgi:hypothetical protein
MEVAQKYDRRERRNSLHWENAEPVTGNPLYAAKKIFAFNSGWRNSFNNFNLGMHAAVM